MQRTAAILPSALESPARRRFRLAPWTAPRLNGVQLEPSPSGVFPLPELAPHTTYQVTWDAAVPSDQAISFATGNGPSLDPAPALTSSVEVTRNPADAGRCALVRPQGCFSWPLQQNGADGSRPPG